VNTSFSYAHMEFMLTLVEVQVVYEQKSKPFTFEEIEIVNNAKDIYVL